MGLVLAPLIPYAIAGAQMGLSWLNQNSSFESQSRQRKAEYKAQKQQALLQNQLQNERIRKANAYRLKIWQTKLDTYNKNLQLIDQAANLTYASMDAKSLDSFRKNLFNLQQLEVDLLENEGIGEASGLTGKSNRRFSRIRNEGRAGQGRATLLQNLIGEQAALRFESIGAAQQFDQARLNAWQNVSVAPMMEDQVNFSFPEYQGLEAPNPWLQAANIAWDGVKTFGQFSAPNVKSSGGGGGNSSSLRINPYAGSNLNKLGAENYLSINTSFSGSN